VLRDEGPSNGAITHAEPDCLAWGAEFRSRDGLTIPRFFSLGAAASAVQAPIVHTVGAFF
jgi:hypothetical protein